MLNLEPRKIKAVSNVSRLTKQEPKLVLKTIHEVVSKMGVPNRVKGWVVRVQNRDNMGRVIVLFIHSISNFTPLRFNWTSNLKSVVSEAARSHQTRAVASVVTG